MSSPDPHEKHRHLLHDETVKRWHDNVARGSEITADVYLRRLASFCMVKSLTPRSLATMPVKQIESLLMDYVTDQQDSAGSYLHSTVKAVRSSPVQILRGVPILPTVRFCETQLLLLVIWG